MGLPALLTAPRRTTLILVIPIGQICLAVRIEGGDSRRVVPGLMLVSRSAIILVPFRDLHENVKPKGKSVLVEKESAEDIRSLLIDDNYFFPERRLEFPA